MVWSNLNIFVFLDIFESFLKTEHHRRNNAGLLVGTRSTGVGKLLRLGDIHHNIAFLGVLSHNLSGIDLLLREYEEAATVLKLVEGISISRSSLHSYERAIGAALNVALPWLVFKEAVRHDCLAGRTGEHIAAQANDTTRWYVEVDKDAVVLGLHRHHLASATSYHIDYLA